MPLLSGRLAVISSVLEAVADHRARQSLLRAIRADRMMPSAECPCCGYVGKFIPAGRDAQIGRQCPSCLSYDRHRLVALAIRDKFLEFGGKDVIHFAPEVAIRPLILKEKPSLYQTADFDPGKADKVLNIESIDLPDASFDMAIASHVLEHVNDGKALAELHRILRPGGQLMAMVPLAEGWASTYENAEIVSPEDRELHFGRYDHIRFYGADFRDRVREAGFRLTEYTARPDEVARHRLTRGEKVFLASR